MAIPDQATELVEPGDNVFGAQRWCVGVQGRKSSPLALQRCAHTLMLHRQFCDQRPLTREYDARRSQSHHLGEQIRQCLDLCDEIGTG
jgi:hypothetical protein